MKKACSVLLLLMLVCAATAFAQYIPVTGKVQDAQKGPLPGVTVLVVENPTKGIATDINGNFSIDAKVGEHLKFSFIGFKEQTFVVSPTISPMTVILQELNQVMDEVVVIGYGTSKRKDLTGSVASVSADKLETTPAVSLNEALQGKTAGVQVNLGDNAPGGGVSVLIRGKGSIGQSNDPIYVVDGIIMEGTLNNINVNDIASIDILKDASAAAIYGSRAANGVVIVTTKRGKQGKGMITFNARTSIQKASNLPKMLNAQELAEIRIEGNVNNELDAAFRANPGMGIDEYRTKFYALKDKYTTELPLSMFSEVERKTLQEGKSYDWYDEIAQTGVVQDYTLAFSGGTEKTNYYISTNYYNHKGLVKGSEHKRLSFRMNLEQQVKEWLKVGVNSSFSNSNTQYASSSIGNGLGANPMYPFEIDGKKPLNIPFYTARGQSNPVLSQNINNDAKSQRYSVNGYVMVNFTPDLFVRSTVSVDAVNNFAGYFCPSDIEQGQSDQGIARINNDAWMDVMQENTLNYSKTFKEKHRLSALIGNTVQVNTYRGNQQYGTGFATNVMGYNNIGSASKFPSAQQKSNKIQWQLASFIGRVNYTFNDKYIFTATGRYDGNSKYGTDNKWGFFPSFAGAWRISSESFMKNLKFLDDMKVRVGWGELGNSNVAAYSSFTQLAPGIAVDKNGKPINTIQNIDQIMGNPNLRWERQQQWNAGLDVTAFKSRLHFSLDLYQKTSKDLVMKTPIPVTTGYLNIYSNVGELQNRGIEITVGGRIIDREVKWDVDLNWSANRNKITKLYGGLKKRINDVNNPTAAGWWVGKSLSSIYAYHYEGIWQWGDDREKMDMMRDGQKGGDMYYPGENKIKDVDKSGSITTEDREIVGCSDPKWYGGFSTSVSYKNFTLGAVFNYVYGNDVWNRSYHEYTLGAGYGFQNMMTDVKDRWSVDNQKGSIPRAHSNNLERMLISSRVMQDGSYLRMKTATLTYNFPEKLLKKMQLSSLSLYVSGENLLTWTKYKGNDPESVSSGYDETYPNAKGVSFGINVSF